MMNNTNFKRYTITTALPYANGPVHIGHLAGVYIPADIYARYLRSKGEDVLLIGGSDEHGVPITIRAKKEGLSPQQVVDKYHEIIKKSFEELNISFDIYSRTSSQTHHETSSAFFTEMNDKNLFIEQFTDQFYDVKHDQFLADRYLKGTCPHCGNPNAYGDQCENCGTSLNGTDLINPVSALSGEVPVLKPTKHWFLPLDQYEPFLRKWILEDHKEWKANVSGQCKSWLDAGLHPRAVTRDLDWGVPVPLEEAKGKVLYVWFDAPIGYISATKELFKQRNDPQGWEKYWKEDDSKLVHFIGKDNIVFHCIIFPSMLHAHGGYVLPENVPANEFLNLEGNKISTSRNWAVWLHEYLEDFKGKGDILRYVLCATAPETKDNDFTWKDFQARNNNELVAVWGNFVNRALVLTEKYYDNIVPATGVLSELDQDVLQQMANFPAKIAHSIEQYRFREALGFLMDLARLGNKYLAETEPWKLIKVDEERVKTIMNIALQISANLAIVAEPFMPESAAKLNGMLNLTPSKWTEAGRADLIKVGHQLNKASLLFEKIEDEAIAAQLQKLEDTKKQNELDTKVITPLKPIITFDDFGKMDIRLGTIIAAEAVPKTKKLLKLTVDTGLDQRTVVSGIAEHYTPEAIIGQQVCVLVNLAPRDLKGITSQGMILMAEDKDGALKFVSPTQGVANGSGVS